MPLTTSYSRGKQALCDILSMYLGLWEEARLRKQKNHEDLLWRVDMVEKRIKEITKNFGLASIQDYFNIDPNEWIKGLDNIITELKGNNPNLEKQTQYDILSHTKVWSFLIYSVIQIVP